jgi:cytochrome c553
MRFSPVVAIAIAIAATAAAQSSTPVPPPWAYGFAGPASAAPAGAPGGRGAGGGGRGGAQAAPDTTKRTLAGSTLSFTLAEIRNANGPADWFPGDHPTMPSIVAQGRREAQILACSLCHYPNGKGRPENAAVSGLPMSYFIQTMQDFRNDARKSADTRKANTQRMIAFAKAMSDSEIRVAAEYFSSMKWTPWIRVVEADQVPKTRSSGGLFIPVEGAEAGMEPIGDRIIEVPENAMETETLRNPRSGFVAYVPKGSLARGEAVAKKGQCQLCHGPDLLGLGPVPGIAGRSPSYMVRQMYDMQSGNRKGVWTPLMSRVVGPLSVEEMRDVAAYVASLKQ